MTNKKKKNVFMGPTTVMIILTLLVAIISTILSKIGFNGSQTLIVDGTLETTMVTVNNAFSIDGIKYVFGNILTNLSLLKLVSAFIVSLIGISICEKSGLLKAFFRNEKLNSNKLVILTVFIGLISSILGEYSYALLLPLTALFYKYNDSNPIYGTLVMFLSITLGLGLGLIFDYNDYVLGNLTQISASLDVDKNYKYSLLSTIYISISSLLIVTALAPRIFKRFLKPKMGSVIKEEIEDNTSKKALYFSNFAFLLLLVLVVYMIIPGLPGSGILLDNNQKTYIAKLFSDNASFKEGIVFIIAIIMMICGYIYGKVSKTITSSNEYSLALSKSFDGMGYVFVLLFFSSILINVVEYTNIGTVLGTILVDFMGSLEFSGIPLIITFFIVVILMSILLPSILDKWILLSPIVVPLFMRSNITPEFTQFIFKIADGVGKTLTPIFPCLLMTIGIMQKYNNAQNEITLFSTIKKYLSTVTIIALILLFVIVAWYIVGIPLGIGSYTTL